MGLFRRPRASSDAAAVLKTAAAAPTSVAPTLEEPGDDQSDVSDVYVCRRDDAAIEVAVDASVTLFVTGWHNVEPGPLSWPFPSMRAALDAVRKMKNAVEWSIALGKNYETIEEARASGMIVIEQRA